MTYYARARVSTACEQRITTEPLHNCITPPLHHYEPNAKPKTYDLQFQQSRKHTAVNSEITEHHK